MDDNILICDNCNSLLDIRNKKLNINSKYIDDIYYSVYYNKFIREIIKDFKYNRKTYLYKLLGQIMLDTLLETVNIEYIDMIMYMPSHWRKRNIRGFNQAELLAEYISAKLNIDISYNNLIKTRHTRDQNKLDNIERRYNLIDAFKIKDRDKIRDMNILLVDDIITTGSTFKEVSKTIIENGGENIIGITLTSSRK